MRRRSGRSRRLVFMDRSGGWAAGASLARPVQQVLSFGYQTAGKGEDVFL